MSNLKEEIEDIVVNTSLHPVDQTLRILALITQSNKDLLERVGSEVIPAGAITGDPRGEENLGLILSTTANVMKRQRSALQKIEEELSNE